MSSSHVVHHLVFENGTPAELLAWLPLARAKELAQAWVFIGLAGRQDMAETMVQFGVDVDYPDPDGPTCTALMCASSCGHLGMVRWLLAQGADASMHLSKDHAETLGSIWFAIRDGHPDILEALLPYVSPATLDAMNPSPLLLACSRPDLRFIRALWAHGCSLDVTMESGRGFPWHRNEPLNQLRSLEIARRESRVLDSALQDSAPPQSPAKPRL